MKGAIGNATIMNIVITFMFLFFALLIGSMAYSKAYKTKNFLINLIEETEASGEHDFDQPLGGKLEAWDTKANDYLRKVGYPLNENGAECPDKDGYNIYINTKKGRYDYCIYRKGYVFDADNDSLIKRRYNYMVLVYMKFDFPVIGRIMKITSTGETKAYTLYQSEFKIKN